MNGCSWYIAELSQEEIKEEMEKRNDINIFLFLCKKLSF